jgi:SAM-dependent methyltransferase
MTSDEAPSSPALEYDSLPLSGSDMFANIRRSFADLGFNESNIRDRYLFESDPAGSFVLPTFPKRRAETITGLDILVHLFMGQESLPLELVEQFLGSRCFSELREVNLIRLEDEGATCRATVRIEPVKELLVCADLFPRKSPSKKVPLRSDHVYRPWDFSAQMYGRIIPEIPCRRFLEMCCGSAYVCLAAAKNFAESVYGVDINDRAIRFAEFNKKLNGVENVTLYCGDLFEPVQSQTFDRIVAHPPYVPALVESLTFADGGVDGERVSTALIRDMPRYLADGGEFCSYLALSDRVDAPAELRVREMLGTYGPELDVALLVMAERSPASFLISRSDPTPFSEENEQLQDACRKLGITRFVTTALTIRSRRGSAPSTLRHRAVSWETVRAMSETLTFARS